MTTWQYDIELHTFNSRQDMVLALADATQSSLLQTIADEGAVTWFVSGGSTPQPLFEEMCKRSLPWQHISIALVDERWVGLSHARSNEAFVRKHLACAEAEAAQIISMKTEHSDPFLGAAAVEEAYQALPPAGPLLLGMGPDGHTASLFPDAEGLEAALAEPSERLTAPIRALESQVTGAEVERSTLTLAAIKKARFPHLMITGEEKRAVLIDALEAGGSHIGLRLPVARVIQAMAMPLTVYWAP